MRTMSGTIITAAIICAMGVGMTASAGACVQVSVGCNTNAQCNTNVECNTNYDNYEDDDVNCENLIVIDDNQVGYWVMLPSGRWVFRCRSMWFDAGLSDWRFGPWWNNVSISYGCQCHNHGGHWGYCPSHGVRYNHYFTTYFPRRPFPAFRRPGYNHSWQEARRDDRNYGSREQRYSAPQRQHAMPQMQRNNESQRQHAMPQMQRNNESQPRQAVPQVQRNSDPQRSQTTIRRVERPQVRSTTTMNRMVVRDVRRR
jgi:hypothetical protein